MRAIVLALGFLFASSASAQAASVGLDVSASTTPSGQRSMTVRYDGTYANERNDLLISPDGADVLITDAAATLRQPTSHLPDPPACTLSADAHTVRCPLPAGAILSASVLAGGGDDTVDVRTSTPSASAVDGGAGNDTITTDGGSLVGGSGDDVLTARWLSSTVDAGDGADRVTGSPQVDLIVGGPGNDVLEGGAGNDTIHDGGPADPDADDDELRGGEGVDALYSHGGIDRLQGGADTDYLFARDSETAPGSPKAATADTLDCGVGTDYFQTDAVDLLAACETAFDPCTAAPYPGRPAFPCAKLPDPAALPAPPAPAPAPAAPAPTPAPPRVKAPPAPLSARLRLDATRLRPPLTRIPRGLITLSATAEVTITLAREQGTRRIALSGTIARRVGRGEKNVSLVVLLGGRQKFLPGRYWVTLAARTSDGRTATSRAVLRMLRAKAAPKRRS